MKQVRVAPMYTLEQRVAAFWAKVDKKGPRPPLHKGMSNCWVWTGCTDGYGYGTFSIGGSRSKQSNRGAHRVAFFMINGYWPPEEIDHQCHVRACVRPDHLKKVAHKANTRNRAVKVCRKGHKMEDPNLYYYGKKDDRKRRCKACMRATK